MKEAYIKLCKELSDALVREDLMEEAIIDVIKIFMLELHEDISKGLTKEDFDLIVLELVKNLKTASRLHKITRIIDELDNRQELEHEKYHDSSDNTIVILKILLNKVRQLIDAAKASIRKARPKNDGHDKELKYEGLGVDDELLKFNKKLSPRLPTNKEPPEITEIFVLHPFNNFSRVITDFSDHLLYAGICMSEYGKTLPRPDFEINAIQKSILNFNRNKVSENNLKYFQRSANRYVGLLLQCIELGYDKLSDYQHIDLLKDPIPENTNQDSYEAVSQWSSELYISKLMKILKQLSMTDRECKDPRCEFVLQQCILEFKIATPIINDLNSFVFILKKWGLYSKYQVIVEQAENKLKVKIIQDDINEDLSKLLEKIKKGIITCEEFFSDLAYKKTNIQYLVSAVASTPVMLSKFIDYYFQGKNLGSKKIARFENALYREFNHPNVMQTLSFEDRKKVVSSRWFLPNNVRVIFKLFSRLDKVQAKELFMLIQQNRILERDKYEEYIAEYYYPSCHFDMRNALRFAYANAASRFSPVNMDEFSAFSHSIELTTVFSPERMPLALLVIIASSSVFDTQTFAEFIDRFDKANKHADKHAAAGAPERHVIDYDDFITKHITKLSNLYQLMGDNLFRFMASKCATSNLSLNRFFNTFTCITDNYSPLISNLINFLQKPAVQISLFTPILRISKQDYNDLGNILLYIVHFESLKSNLPAEYADDVNRKISTWSRSQLIGRNFTLRILLTAMSEDLVEIYIKALNPPHGIALDKNKLLADPELVGRLIVGRNAMKNSAFAKIYDRLVLEDLIVGGSFNKFSMDTQQEEGSLGRLLAEHNARIVHELQAHRINTEFALNYDQVTEFTTRTADDKNISLLCKVIWADLINVEKELINELSQADKDIVKCIETIRKQVVKGTKEKPNINTGVIKSEPMEATIARLHKLTIDIAKTLSTDNPAKVYLDALSTHLTQLEAAKKENLTQTVKIPEMDFCIQQWDKQKIETFILGDYLSCCLAPDGSEFPAIVQRRLDSAMMMHVVMDKGLNEPVCGNWLFLAYDTNNPEDVYVVANYYEIRAGLGAKPALRDKLVDELTKFTAEYAETIGAKGYLLSPLSYGLIPDFKGKFATKEITIAKVGGFFNPMVTSAENTDFCYYLKSPILNYIFYIVPAKSPALSSGNVKLK